MTRKHPRSRELKSSRGGCYSLFFSTYFPTFMIGREEVGGNNFPPILWLCYPSCPAVLLLLLLSTELAFVNVATRPLFTLLVLQCWESPCHIDPDPPQSGAGEAVWEYPGRYPHTDTPLPHPSVYPHLNMYTPCTFAGLRNVPSHWQRVLTLLMCYCAIMCVRIFLDYIFWGYFRQGYMLLVLDKFDVKRL